MAILRICLFAALLALDALVPAQAWPVHGSGVSSFMNACGATPAGQTWCVGTDGWTVFSGTVPVSPTGTCSGSSGTYNGTCVVWADDTTASSFNGTISANALTINSGTPPSVGQSLVINSAVVATITGGSNPNFTLSTSPGNQTSAMTSSAGNDTTCASEVLPAGMTSINWSAKAPVTVAPCYSLSTAHSKLRSGHPDWIVLRKGGIWAGGFTSATNATWSGGGLSLNEPMLIGAYGVGARPVLEQKQTSGNITGCLSTASSDGAYLAIDGIECYTAVADPNSSEYLSANLTGDIPVSGAEIDNVTVPTWVQNGFNGTGYVVYGSGLHSGNNGATVTWSAGTPNTLTLSGSTAGFTNVTGLKFQIMSNALTDNSTHGMFFNGQTNFLYIEDVMFRYGGLTLKYNVNLVPAPTFNIVVRRNEFLSPWTTNAIFVGGFTTTPTPNEYLLFEENVEDQGAASLDPNNYGGSGNVFDHCYYGHDPSVQIIFQRNVLTNCSTSAIQFREGGSFYNNLSIANGFTVSPQVQNYSNTSTYNVFDHAVDNRIGFRIATAASVAGSATTISFDGQSGRSGSLANTFVTDLSNPGALPEWQVQATSTTTKTSSTVTSPTSMSLVFPSPFTTVQAGVRGDGVQPGDLLQFVTGSFVEGADPGMFGGGLYEDAGPGTGGVYPAGSTVSIASGTPAVVTDTVGRATDEIFQFTSGSPPSGTSLNTDYCTTNVVGLTYDYYPATAGACPGVSGNAIAAGTSASGIARQGSRKFTFAGVVTPDFTQIPIPNSVSIGTSVCFGYRDGTSAAQNYFSGANGCTTVSFISSDRLTMFTADDVANPFTGNSNGNGHGVMGFFTPDASHVNPTFRFGPNNLGVNNASVAQSGPNAFVTLDFYSNYFDVSRNYIYNWTNTSTANDIKNAISVFASTQSGNLTQVSDVGPSNTTYPWASVDAYDASVVHNTFTATLSDNGNGGSFLDVTGGGGPNVGDILFAADGSNTVTQYMKVTSQVSSTRWVTNKTQAVGPISMISGSYTHFITQALANSHDSWNSAYTARAANNFIRTKIKCGDQTAYPGSPACPLQ